MRTSIVKCHCCGHAKLCRGFLPASRWISKDELVACSSWDLEEHGVQIGDEVLRWNRGDGIDARYREYVNSDGFRRIELLSGPEGGGYVKCKLVPKRRIPLCDECTFELGSCGTFKNWWRAFLSGFVGTLAYGMVQASIQRRGARPASDFLQFLECLGWLVVAVAGCCWWATMISGLKSVGRLLCWLIGWHAPMGRLAALRLALPSIEFD